MHRHYFLGLVLLVCFNLLHAQKLDSAKEINLQEVVIKAFEQNRRLKDVPAAINYIGPQTLRRFNNQSIVSAVNSMPGVRMEERSPGSYRLNIRGSSARSPFGVRNVKIYYNDIPYTDPGGQTYLNQLGFYNVQSIEIIKGPGNSLYGAGTGGVMLIESLPQNEEAGLRLAYTTGSYNQQQAQAAFTTHSEKIISRMQFEHFTSNGYRLQSKMKRDVLSWNSVLRIDEKRRLNFSFLYSDLFYQTPGGLTLAEFKANPKAARPGAANAHAAIYQKTFLAGASYTQELLKNFTNKTVMYGAFTELKNPNLRGYDRSSEPHVGARSVFTFLKNFQKSILNLNAGTEWQQGFATASSFKNVAGNADSLRYYDDIRNRQAIIFVQAEYDIANWMFIAGASSNGLKIKAQRFTPRALGLQQKNFDNQLSPRLSISKKWEALTMYGGVSKGFSPPTTSELLPTGGNINLALHAEQGTNYDLGLRSTLFNKLYIDVNAFSFALKNTIVVRKDAQGGDFYVNAGKTKQHGIETYISYPFYNSTAHNGLFWLSHTWHNFHYKEFKKLTDDFSGKQLPGEPQHALATGMDLTIKKIQGSLTYSYTGKLPLNDGNSAYTKPSHLLGFKAAYLKNLERLSIKIFAGIENIFNENYSLGNDINGFGGRYYNAAPGRNFYGGINFLWNKKENN